MIVRLEWASDWERFEYITLNTMADLVGIMNKYEHSVVVSKRRELKGGTIIVVTIYDDYLE